MAVEESIALVVVSAGDGKDASECCEVIPLGFLLSFVSLCSRHRSSAPIRVTFSIVTVCQNALKAGGHVFS